jgi:hypothetical protein
MKKYLNSLDKIDKIAYVILFGMLLLILINGCTTPPQTLYCVKGEISGGVVCTEIYQPVIAPDGTEYPNSCYAEKDGWDNSCLELKAIYD